MVNSVNGTTATAPVQAGQILEIALPGQSFAHRVLIRDISPVCQVRIQVLDAVPGTDLRTIPAADLAAAFAQGWAKVSEDPA